MIKYILIWDLDETLINSAHRTPNNPDGTLNLPAYIANHTPENVAMDTLLPAIKVFQQFRNTPGTYLVILTARDMKQCDYDFLQQHGIVADKIMSRDKCRSEKHYKSSDGDYKRKWLIPFLSLKQFAGKMAIMIDDAKPVKTALRKFIPVLCAHKLNARMA